MRINYNKTVYMVLKKIQKVFKVLSHLVLTSMPLCSSCAKISRLHVSPDPPLLDSVPNAILTPSVTQLIDPNL